MVESQNIHFDLNVTLQVLYLSAVHEQVGMLALVGRFFSQKINLCCFRTPTQFPSYNTTVIDKKKELSKIHATSQSYDYFFPQTV